jgi:hypothetical protein
MAYAVKSITWLMQGRRRLAANIMTLSILPMDAVELVIVSVLSGVLILSDLFEEISTDVRLRVALLWPCLIEAFDFCFAATHDWKSRRRWRVWGTLADGWC